MVPDNLLHSLIVSRLQRALENYVQRAGLDVYVARGAGFAIGSSSVRIPDLLAVSYSRVTEAIAADGGLLHLSPELAAEVVLPDESAAALESSVRRYIEGGTNSVWVICPKKRTVMDYRSSGLQVELTDDMMLANSDLLPGFGIGIRDLFPEVRSG